MNLIIASGIQPGPTGVGRFLSELIIEAENLPLHHVNFLFGNAGGPSMMSSLNPMHLGPLWKVLKNRFDFGTGIKKKLTTQDVTRPPFIMIHPQTLGFNICLDILENRRNTTWLYLVDSSFFCVRSYNYLPGEFQSCQRCLGGKWEHIHLNRCKPWPSASPLNVQFLDKLLEGVRKKTVKLFAQNEKQADLAREHFGPEAVIKIVGMRADFGNFEDILSNPAHEEAPVKTFDIAYHGLPFLAKGPSWTIELAEKCSKYTFLFPFKKRAGRVMRRPAPSNCAFIPMTWETGLKNAIESAKIVLVPSLWSAPIEGALIKSIAYGKRTAVVYEPSAFSSELPDNIALKLSPDIQSAVREMTNYIDNDKPHDIEIKKKWISQFYGANTNILDRMVKSIEQDQIGSATNK